MAKPRLFVQNNAVADNKDDAARALLDLAVGLVESGQDILERHVVSDEQLLRPSVLLPGGSMGKHFRHVIETFDALLTPSLGGNRVIIDYDAVLPESRKLVATSLETCRQSMAGVRDNLVSLGQSPHLARQFAREVDVVAVTPTTQKMASTFGRELWFCALHTIHHYTILRAIAVNEMGISLPVAFGTSPATLVYRDENWKPPVPNDVKAKL